MLVLSKTDPFYLPCYYTFSLSIKKKKDKQFESEIWHGFRKKSPSPFIVESKQEL